MNGLEAAGNREREIRDAKPVLEKLCSDIRFTHDTEADKVRRNQLDVILAALSVDLQDPRAADVEQEMADAFRQEWRLVSCR